MKVSKLLKWFIGIIIASFFLIVLVYTITIMGFFTKHIWDGRYRTYQSLYSNITPGMSKEDVEALLADHYPPGGKRQPPDTLEFTSTSLTLLMNPEHSTEPNAESISISFHDDKVVEKRYTVD